MQIRKLTIENFRSIESLVWRPSSGVNCLVGPGDAGKTSILDAITLLLAPYVIGAANELDYRDRNLQRGFRIEGVLTGMPHEPLIQQRRIPPMRGWKNGELTPLPDEDGAELALVCQVSADPNLDLSYEILPLDGDPASFAPGLRRNLALARISAADRANRDLRLGAGSLLARYFKGPGFGGNLTEAVRAASDELQPPPEMAERFAALKGAFSDAGLPGDLQFGLLPAIGWSLTGMIALATGASPSTAVPIANAGAGTRNLSLLELSAALSAEHPIIIVDEPERGLEPYRQRRIGARLSALIGAHGQAFVTTHAPPLLSALKGESVWHMPQPGQITQVDAGPLMGVLDRQPDAFFARAPVFCEGPTEIGLLKIWLPPRLGGDLASRGVELVDGEGQPHVLAKLSAFFDAGIPCAGFVDNESDHSGRRDRLAGGILCFSWETETDIEEALSVHLSLDGLSSLVDFAARLNEVAATTYCAQIRDHLKTAHGDVDALAIPRFVDQVGEDELRKAVGRVMSKTSWFKTEEKGSALAAYLDDTGIPKPIEAQIDNFASALKARFKL